MTRPARPGLRRDPARRAERPAGPAAAPLAPSSYRVTHPLPPHPDAIRAAVRLLRQAERPLLMVGGGVELGRRRRPGRPAERAVRDPDDHRLRPQRRGAERAPALHRPAGARRRAGGRRGLPPGRSASWPSAHGSASSPRTSTIATSGPASPIVQIDVESRDIGRYYPVAVGIQADAREATQALLDALGARRRIPRAGPRGDRRPRRCARSARRVSPARPGSTPSRMKPQRVYAELRRALPPDTIVALDAGAAPAYGYDRLQFSRPRTLPHAARSRRSRLRVSRSRWAPSSAGRRRRWWRSTATAAS